MSYVDSWLLAVGCWLKTSKKNTTFGEKPFPWYFEK